MTTRKTWLSKEMSAKELWTTRVVTAFLGILAVLALGLGAIAPRLAAWVAGDPLVFTSDAQQAGPSVDEALRPGSSARWAGRVEYTVTDPTALQRFGDLIGPLILLALLVLGWVLVWRLLSRVASGDPFRTDAMRTFRMLSLLLGLGAICLPVVAFAGRMFTLFESQEKPSMYAAATPESLAVALTGLAGAGLVEVLGVVFRRGTELRHDADGLV